MPHELAWEDNGVYWKYTGNILAKELVESISEIYGDPRFDNLRYKLVDLSEIDSLEIDNKDVMSLAYKHKAASISNPNIKNAIIIKAELKELADKFANILDDSPWDVGVFDNIDDANNWLDRRLPV